MYTINCESRFASGKVRRFHEIEGQDGFPGDAEIERIAERECEVEGGLTNYLVPTDASWDDGDRTITCIEDYIIRYQVGDCLDVDFLLVDCSGDEANGEVVSVENLGPSDAPFPGDDDLAATAREACGDISYLVPTDETWGASDRELVCVDERFLPLAEGDCLDADVYLVPCDDPAAVDRVVDVVSIESAYGDDEPYPGRADLEDAAADACDDAYLNPTDDSWLEGDRDLVCLALVN